MWYLDDVTVCGEPDAVLRDLGKISEESRQLGLELNNNKSEVIIIAASGEETTSILQNFNHIAPGIRHVHVHEASLLGAPLSEEGIHPAITSKVAALSRLKDNLEHVGVHNSLFLLKHCFLLPRLLYLLRTTPTWTKETALKLFDSTQRELLEKPLNISLGEEA